jgi:hypothetical protein
LTAEQQAALDVSPLERTDAQHSSAAAAKAIVKVDWTMVVRDATSNVRVRAKEILRQYVKAKETADTIDRYREIVNFNVWRAPCEAEVTEPADKY